MKKIFLLVIILLGVMTAFCQAMDSVTLKDGSVVEGIIRQYEPGKFVVIDLADGSQKMYNWDVVSSVDKKSETVETPTERDDLPGKLKMNAKSGIKLQYDETLPSDKLREYWQKQGGNRFYNDFYLNVISIKMKMADTSSTSMDGGGFGMGGSVNWLYFNPPEYTIKKFYSLAAKLGFCYDANLNVFTMDDYQEFGDGYHMEINTDIITTNVDLGANLGVNLGVGTFMLSQKWFGAIMGLAWRPVYRITSTNTTTAINSNIPGVIGRTTTDSSDSKFDTGSLEYSIDIGSIKAMSEKFAPRATLKLNFIYVPPIGKNKMTMMMFGIGIGRYK